MIQVIKLELPEKPSRSNTVRSLENNQDEVLISLDGNNMVLEMYASRADQYKQEQSAHVGDWEAKLRLEKNNCAV